MLDGVGEGFGRGEEHLEDFTLARLRFLQPHPNALAQHCHEIRPRRQPNLQ